MSDSEKVESEKIGAFWKNKGKNGVEYLAGTVNGERVVVFLVKEKRTKQSPDYQVFRSLSRPTNEEPKPAKQEVKPTNNRK